MVNLPAVFTFMVGCIMRIFNTRGLLAISLLIGFQNIASGQTLYELLPDVLQTHNKIRAASTDLDASKESANAAGAAYFPTVDLKINTGTETQMKYDAADTDMGFNESALTVKQLLWDFGKTSAIINRAELSTNKSSLALDATKQQVLLEATEAYFNLLRAIESLNYAMQSENNIKQQTRLEEARVDRGRGIAADVLQAKTTLAGAMATRVQAQGALVSATNRYRAVFKQEVGDLSTYRRPATPYDKLPKTLEEAIEIALANNLSMRMAQVDIQSALETVNVDKATMYAPKIDITLQTANKNNVGGIVGPKQENLAKVELNFPLFSGGKDSATYRASSASAASAVDRKDDLARVIEEQVRNAWQALRTQSEISGFLRNQSNIAGEFLDVARKERQMGRRSLIDILNSETSYISSVSAAVSAETDTSLAVYRLISAMGQLEPGLYEINTTAVDAKDITATTEETAK